MQPLSSRRADVSQVVSLYSWIFCCVSLYFPYLKHHLLSCLCLFAVPQMQNTPFSQSLTSGGKPNLSTVTTVSPPVLTQQQVPPQQSLQQPQVPPQGPPALNHQPPLAPQPMPTNQQTPPTTQPGMVRLEKCISVNTYLDSFEVHTISIYSCFLGICTCIASWGTARCCQ